MDIRLFTSHVGYLTGRRKRAILAPELLRFGNASLYDCRRPAMTDRHWPIVATRCPWGEYGVVDFTDADTPGMWQITVGNYEHRSAPFMIGPRVYAKTFRMALQSFHLQHCGVEVEGFHGPCHLDDAVRRDDGAYHDTVGGWHDAGDVRKWVISCLPIVAAMVRLHERLGPTWNSQGQPWGDVLAEARWENDYFLKMQDPATGLIWNDVGGGVNGDNSDNRWTDNRIQSGDERHINPAIRPHIQWGFIRVQAMMAKAFAAIDPAYSAKCLAAMGRCLAAVSHQPSGIVLDDGAAVLAWLAVHRIDGSPAAMDFARTMAHGVLAGQNREHAFGQSLVRGFFHETTGRARFLKTHFNPGVPAEALAELLEADPAGPLAGPIRDSLRMLLEDYLLPLCERNPFGLIPYGLYRLPPVDGANAWPLGGELSFRYFKWNEATSAESAGREKETFEHGGTSHLLNWAMALAKIWRVTGLDAARDLALRQLEWVMGANPLGMCLMTGGGINTPYPYTPQVGLIPGGLINGFVGRHADLPTVHDAADQRQWGSTEYWGPHNGNYLATLTELDDGGREVV